jgi:hypothetical protein
VLVKPMEVSELSVFVLIFIIRRFRIQVFKG